MQKIENDIRTKNFEKVYLLFGEEDYLCRYYKKLLKMAIIGNDDEMNFSAFDNAFDRVTEIIDLADTLPFFAERRLIIVENSSFFKKESTMPDYIKEQVLEQYAIYETKMAAAEMNEGKTDD